MLDNAVLPLAVINPDGQDIVVTGTGGTSAPPTSVALNELYQKYIGHDNNRDAYMLNVVESRVVAQHVAPVEPQISTCSTRRRPFHAHLAAALRRTHRARVAGLMSARGEHHRMTIAQALETNGQVGPRTWGRVRRLVPGLHRLHAMLQNIASFWTGDALYAMPRRSLTPSTNSARVSRPRPAVAHGESVARRLVAPRDAVDYMETASLATLE